MGQVSRILLQTTIPHADDDWHIGRFSLLHRYLASVSGSDGTPLFEVTARNRDAIGEPDNVLSTLDTSRFDELWLFAVDTGDGLTDADCEAIGRFRQRGGGLLVARDHMDLGSSVCTLGGVGAAHFFHSKNLDPDLSHRQNDDTITTDIQWPNFHSGANGDFQRVEPQWPLHPVLTDATSPDGAIRFLPAHPHEGDVGKPEHDDSARVIAKGCSKLSGKSFNLAVAFEPGEGRGPAIAQSTFHHFADYNWDPAEGAPSFVSEPPGHALAGSPEARESIRAYVRNVALWLAGRPVAVL
ncbi:hypothetical protein [Dyella sp. C11]|uniref:hypothetical protein n=1 Tax=Dyella sp. C11 TaxID=2126991 RepID=UPI000D65BCC5|nr:hypothetical protein [Dyella sp. C11]